MRLLVLILCLAVYGVPGFAQEELIIMNSAELGAHKRALVRFAHEKHAENIGCNGCHHDYDIYGVNTSEDEGQQCSQCHTPEARDNPVPLKRAIHLQCKGCHQTLIAKRQASGPLMCGQCHIRASK